VNGIPQHSRWLVERLLTAYCARICPPTARNTVLIGFRIEHDRVVVQHLRRIFGIPGTREAQPVAQFRYFHADQCWALFASTRTGQWQRHPPLTGARSFLELLREFDADPLGLFWGRIDGKSLRWCNAKGRCDECELRYGEVLGNALPAPQDDRWPKTP